MLDLYQQKYSLISDFYLFTKDIQDVIKKAEDITQEETMHTIMQILEKRSEIIQKVDALDREIRSAKKDQSEAEELEKVKKAAETLLGQAISIEHENQKAIEARMRELSGSMKEINNTQKEIKAYIPNEGGSAHIDVSQ